MFNSSQIGIFVKYWKWLIEKYFILPYDAFNGSLVEQFICWDAGHKINTITKMKNHKQWVICFCLAPIGRVRYGQGQKASVSVLRIPDVSGIAGTRTLIGLQLSIWSIYFHITLIYSEACDLPNLSELWASLELKFKYGKLFGCGSK